VINVVLFQIQLTPGVQNIKFQAKKINLKFQSRISFAKSPKDGYLFIIDSYQHMFVTENMISFDRINKDDWTQNLLLSNGLIVEADHMEIEETKEETKEEPEETKESEKKETIHHYHPAQRKFLQVGEL
jgi:hypothetical protein